MQRLILALETNSDGTPPRILTGADAIDAALWRTARAGGSSRVLIALDIGDDGRPTAGRWIPLASPYESRSA